MRRRYVALIVLLLLTGLAPGAHGQAPSDQIAWNFAGTMAENGSWEMTVTASRHSYAPGDGMTIAIQYTIHSAGLAYNVGRLRGVYTLITGSRTFDGNGEMIGSSHAMVSPILTGVGLPIEGETTDFPTDRFGGKFHHPIDSYEVTPPSDLDVDEENGTISGTSVHGILLDPNIPAGLYQLRIDIGLEIAENTLITLWGDDPVSPGTSEDKQTYAVTSPVSIGTATPPRMVWTLFSNGPCTIAAEDQGFVAASRHTGFHTTTILPMTDSQGAQARYLLEPDFPLVWNPFMRTSGSGLELDYESGWMGVRIQNPDTSLVDLGGAQFAGRRGMGATTLQDRFAYSFSAYGRHLIEMTGWIKDKSGQAYTGGGVYEVYIAKHLDIQTNILEGTPFKTNEYFDSGFQMFPPVPARVQVDWKLDRQSRGVLSSGRFEAPANRWGYYSPPIVSGRNRVSMPTRIQFDDPGEYRVTFKATYQDADGALWMGEKTLTGVVLPADTISLASRPQGTGAFAITSDARYIPLPADTGDTMLIPVPSPTALPTVFTYPMGFFLENQMGFRADDSALCEIPGGTAGLFVVPRLATSNGLFPHIYPESIDRKAYLLSFASRADGPVEARIGDGSASACLPYPTFPWLTGELPVDSAGDIYHFWSAMVYRDIPANSTRYGFYSSGGVVSGETTAPRIHVAPLSLVSDGWGTHNLVMHSLAVQPGSIVSQGASFTPATYFLPLPAESTIQYKVTPPQGNQIIVTVQGDVRGYAGGTGNRFVLEKPGVWEVQTSLVQGEDVGGILGVAVGQPWVFYVIDNANSLPIKFNLPPEMHITDITQPLALTADLSEAVIASGKAYISTTFNGAVVEQTERDFTDSTVEYSIDLAQLQISFPNFSLSDPNDRLVISFYVDGLASTGRRRVAARMVYLQGGILHAGESGYGRIEPRTREELAREQAEAAAAATANEVRGRVPPESQGQ